MSKNRLDESKIRRFMGLSGLTPLGENFIDRIREEEEEAAPAPEADMEMDAELDMGEEPAADGGDAEPAADGGDAEPAATQMANDVADAVADALSDVLGKHGVEVTAGEAGAEPPMDDAPMDDAPMDDAPMDDEPEPAMDEMKYRVEDEEEDEELEEANIELVDNYSIVQEVARRVAARLVKEASRS